MFKKLMFSIVLMLSLAACKDDTTCTKEDLAAKSEEISAKLQENPMKAMSLLPDMQKLAEKTSGLTEDDEPSAEMIAELCKAYDAMLDKL